MSHGAPLRPSPSRTASKIARAVWHSDYLRRSPFNVGGDGAHKEWLHFVVHAGEVDLLVNFSLVDDTRPQARPGTEYPRLVVLARAGDWDGDIELFDPRDALVRGGGIELRYGPNSVRFDGELYHIRVKLRRRPIEIDLKLRPTSLPALSNNIRLELGDRPINWMVLPRLVASGSARIGGETSYFHEVPAYHDHNWGHFHWGRDFAWEWGFSLPERADVPWSTVFVRLSDRSGTRALTQGLFLWKRGGHHRIFRAHELAIAPRGLLRRDRIFKLPRIANVISPGAAADVPAELEARAEADGDWLELRFVARDLAQVCIPNDTDDDEMTVINEVTGSLEMAGEVRGERVELSGLGMFEFVRGG
ncbi:MAG: hypothetical protein ACR2P8_10385 [Myxococcota bacterium]